MRVVLIVSEIAALAIPAHVSLGLGQDELWLYPNTSWSEPAVISDFEPSDDVLHVYPQGADYPALINDEGEVLEGAERFEATEDGLSTVFILGGVPVAVFEGIPPEEIDDALIQIWVP